MVRGYGPLDRIVALQRYRLAERKLKSLERHGRILDIGSGSYPLFLAERVNFFQEKFGIEKNMSPEVAREAEKLGIKVVGHDLEVETRLPFDDEYFDSVSMLAVLEHLDAGRVVDILSDVKRVLAPGGRFLLTTPAPWTDRILRFMAGIGLISSTEIDEHKGFYNVGAITECLVKAGFDPGKIHVGHFEIFVNNWACADK